MTQTAPTLSVILPVFNGEKFLQASVESVLNQTFGDFEFIIIDDGSSDSGPRLLEDFKRKDGRIRHFIQSNKGIGATKNTGVGLSRGKYVAFIDQDDLAYPHRFATQIKFLDEHPEVACVGSYYDFIDEKGRVLDTGTPPVDHQALYVENMLEGLNLLCNSMVMADTRSIIAAGNFEQRFAPADDYDLYLRLGRNRKLMNIAMILGAYRVHASNYSITSSTRMEFHRWEACGRERWTQGLTGVPKLFPPALVQLDQWRYPVHYAITGKRWRIALEFSFAQIRHRPFSVIAWKYLLLVLQRFAFQSALSALKDFGGGKPPAGTRP